MLKPKFPVLASRNTCSGCAACANVCPKDAITMTYDEAGFPLPGIDDSLCISCMLCTKKCPALKQEARDPANHVGRPTIYAGWSQDPATRNASSSGGIFPVLARWVIRQGGIVFGVRLNDDLTAEFIAVEDCESLLKLQGSKYIQAEVHGAYREVNKQLRQGRMVLFSGTPCQMEGLLSVLGNKHPDNLFLVDVACHGVPSKHLLEKYRAWQETARQSNVKHISWRAKPQGWLRFHMHVTFENKSKYSIMHTEDLYMKAFLSDLCLKPACYQCRNGKVAKVSDITLADYWGVQYIHPNWNIKQGVSTILVYTEKGAGMLKNVQDQLFLSEEKWEDVAPHNIMLTPHPLPHLYRRARFMEDLLDMPLPQVINKHIYHCGPRYDIALLGMWWGWNYGAILTTFALRQILVNMQYDVLLMDHAPMTGDSRLNNTQSVFRNFCKEEGMTATPIHTRQDAEALNQRVDTFIVGSDQLWNYAYTQPQGMQYYLDFVDGEKRKIAFATSLGNSSTMPPQDYLDRIGPYLESFHAISVREDDAVSELKTKWNMPATHLLDPVFLPEIEVWKKLATKSTPVPEGLLTYILDPDPTLGQTCADISQTLGMPATHVLDVNGDVEYKKHCFPSGAIYAGVSVYSWLRAFQDSTCIITDSFHGTCFAIIFHKPFLCFNNSARGSTRFTSLLKQFGFEERLVGTSEELISKQHLLQTINCDDISQRITLLKKSALEWLQHSLVSPISKETISKGTQCRKNIKPWIPLWERTLRFKAGKIARRCLSHRAKKILLAIMAKLHIKS